MAPLRFALDESTVFLQVPREDGLDFLEWIGLGRPEFGAIEARTIRPLCHRRLWAVERNLAPFTVEGPGRARKRETGTLRKMAWEILRVLGARTDGIVHFG